MKQIQTQKSPRQMFEKGFNFGMRRCMVYSAYPSRKLKVSGRNDSQPRAVRAKFFQCLTVRVKGCKSQMFPILDCKSQGLEEPNFSNA